MSDNDPIIPHKWMLKAHNQQNVFIWGARERSVHTLMKAFLWALYLPQYPDLLIEVRIGDRYKPDVVAMPPMPDVYSHVTEPLFWGEAGQVAKQKIETLVRRYPSTHFAIAKWGTQLHLFSDIIENALKGVKRHAPFDLIVFPGNSRTRFIDDEGNITISHDDLEWKRFG